jgi:NAD(P)-dependent dehydrogenase (short-subunit alcohol dehydrogenase family)
MSPPSPIRGIFKYPGVRFSKRFVRPPSGAGAILAGKTPLGRLGRITDIAPLVVFLASDESAWITGEVIRAAGGLVVAT